MWAYLYTYPPIILQTYLPTYLPHTSHLPSHILITPQPIYLHTYLLPISHLPSYILIIHQPTHFLLPTYFPFSTYHLTSLHTHLPFEISTYLPTYLPNYLPPMDCNLLTYLPLYLPNIMQPTY